MILNFTKLHAYSHLVISQELGASSVTPLLTERSSSISENRFDRLERVILAASKQCNRRSTLPFLLSPF